MRYCIVETTTEDEALLVKYLPANIKVDGRSESFYKPTIELRLSGDGLPPWCEEVHANYYTRGCAEVLAGGKFRINCGTGMPVEQIHPSLRG